MDKSCTCCSSKKIAIDDVNGSYSGEKFLLKIVYKCLICENKWTIIQEPYTTTKIG